GSGPAMAPSNRAASATVRVMGPLWDRPAQISALGQFGTRPNDGFRPKTPQSAAGIRIDPAPSEPCARGPRPAAPAPVVVTPPPVVVYAAPVVVAPPPQVVAPAPVLVVPRPSRPHGHRWHHWPRW